MNITVRNTLWQTRTRAATVGLSQIDSIPKLTTESAIKSEITVRMVIDGGGADILVRLAEDAGLKSGVEVNAIFKLKV